MLPADPTVRIAARLVDRLVEEAAAAAPREACGLLVGSDGCVEHVVPARNVDPLPTRYRIAPADHFAALRAARAMGLQVIGAYHSHPAGGPEPSPADVAEAVTDFLYLIVGLAPAPAVALWLLMDGNFTAVSFVRT